MDKTLLQFLTSLGQTKVHYKDELLYMEEESARYIHIILEGMVRLYRIDSRGNEVILEYLQVGDFLGELDARSTYQESAVAESTLTLLKIPQQEFIKTYKENLDVAQYVIEALSSRHGRQRQMTKVSITANFTEKVAMFIYEHEKLFCELKQYQVAAMLSVAPETLSRTLKKFKQQGILHFENKKPVVVDKEALREYFDFPYYGS